jgi:hypothetical protein
MVFLGLLLAAVAVTVGAVIVLDNSDAAELTIFGEAIPGVTSLWNVFLAGAVVAIILMTGLMLAFFGIGRSVRTRRELRFLREEHEESITSLEMEKRQLQRELERARRDTPVRQASPSDPRLHRGVSA